MRRHPLCRSTLSAGNMWTHANPSFRRTEKMSQRMRRPLVVKMMATLIGALLATTPALAAPLDVWHIWGGHREQLLYDVLAAFEAEHPGIETMQTLHVFPQHQERFIAGVLA